MRAALGFTLASLPILIAGAASAATSDSIRVMTRNQYLGTDFVPVVLAQTPAEFQAALTAAIEEVAANDFPRRARGLAREIREKRPDVIGLQEVYDFTLNGAHSGPPFVDHLQATLAELEAVGLHYVVAGSVEHVDVTLPFDVDGDGSLEAVRVLDRDVILVRAGIPFTSLGGDSASGGLCGVPIPNPVPVPPFPTTLQSTSSEDGCNYTAALAVESLAGPIVIERGFVGVDVTVRGETYRVVDTHLEDVSSLIPPIFQFLQAVELVGTLQVTTPPDRALIVLGDLNSSPVDVPVGAIPPPYQVMLGSGFTDVWDTNRRAARDPEGFTCCQQADLANPTSLLDERLDLILVRSAQPFESVAVVTGRRRLPPRIVLPFWASDHAGVFGKLLFAR